MHRAIESRVIPSLRPRARRSHAAAAWLAVCLGGLVGACDTTPGEDDAGTTTDAGPTTGASETDQASTAATADEGGSTEATGQADETGTDPTGADSGELGTACTEPREVPPATVDCSGATGVITTTVIIEAGGDDPSILEGVRRVEGSIRINRLDTTNLDFMACVEEVTGDVTIFGNDQLTNLDGLSSLTQIGTDFVFSENNTITEFDGLPNVVSIPRNLIVKNNGLLRSLGGFHQLEEVGDNLLIQSNPALLDVDGLGGLRTVGGVLAITANSSLCISSVNCVGTGITDPAVPPEEWSAQANDFGC